MLNFKSVERFFHVLDTFVIKSLCVFDVMDIKHTKRKLFVIFENLGVNICVLPVTRTVDCLHNVQGKTYNLPLNKLRLISAKPCG